MHPLKDILPESGWLHDYLEFCEPLTEAPLIFHLFSGLGIVAATCGRRVSKPMGAFTVFPNLYTLLVAQSSSMKKSTALNLAHDILRSVLPEIVYPPDFSREVIYDILKDNPQGIFFWDEFGATLENFKASYMGGALEMFTKLYGNPRDFKRRLRKETITVDQPCVSILTASTVEWLAGKIDRSDILAGFLPRFLIVAADKVSKRLPIPPEMDLRVQADLSNRLLRVYDLQGVMTFSEEANALYSSWYCCHSDDTDKDEDRAEIAPFWNRLQVYCIKLAMLFQISKDRKLVIEAGEMDRAIRVTEMCKEMVRKVIVKDFISDKNAKLQAQVLTAIRNRPGVARSELLRVTGLSGRILSEILSTLEESEEVQVSSHKSNGNNKQVNTYVAIRE